MSKKKWIVAGGIVVALVAATVIGRQLTGKTTASAQSSSGDSDKVTTLQVAHTQNYVPYDYVDENGESDGFEVAVLKAVDKKLKNYKFEYTGTSDEDLLIGLESGKYDIGVKGAWYTAERAEKFVIPDEAIGASVFHHFTRRENSGDREASAPAPRNQERRSFSGGYRQSARQEAPASFEDKLSRFLKDSDERLLDLKRNVESKRGGRGARRSD